MNTHLQSFNCREGHTNITQYPVQSKDELEILIQNAWDCFLSKTLDQSNLRILLLANIKLLFLESRDEILTVYCQESSLSASRFDSEYERVIVILDQFIEYLKNDSISISQDKLEDRIINKKNLPIGPVAVFSASNFPLAYSTIGGDTICGLAAGCPVIVKGHPLHPGTSQLCAEIINRAVKKCNLHKGVFGHFLESGYELGQHLIVDSRIKAGGFTGSFKGGMELYQLAQNRRNPIPFFAEMGSLNPVIIHESIENISTHCNNLALAITTDAGQFCTKPGLIFCMQSVYNQAIDSFREEMQKMEAHPMLHPIIFKNYSDRLHDITKAKHTELFIKEGGQFHGSLGFICIDTETFIQNDNLKEEIFGPFTIWIKVNDINEIQECLSSIDGQLTGTYIGSLNHTDFEIIQNLLEPIVGRVIINGVPTGVKVVSSMHHGGPFPASTDSRFTAVGDHAIQRFQRPISIQKNL